MPIRTYTPAEAGCILVRGVVSLGLFGIGVVLLYWAISPAHLPDRTVAQKFLATQIDAVRTSVQDLPTNSEAREPIKGPPQQRPVAVQPVPSGQRLTPMAPNGAETSMNSTSEGDADFFSATGWEALRAAGASTRQLATLNIYLTDPSNLWWEALRHLPGRKLGFLGPSDQYPQLPLTYDPSSDRFEVGENNAQQYWPLELHDAQRETAIAGVLAEAAARLRTLPRRLRVIVLWQTSDRDAFLGLIARYAAQHGVPASSLSAAYLRLDSTPLSFSVEQVETGDSRP